MAETVNKGNNRINSLDVLRIIATFGILIYHFEQIFNFTPGGFWDLTRTFNGSLISEFFFVLSGFLAYHDAKKLKGGSYSFGGYVGRKFKRLVPVIVLPCIVYTFICFLMRSITGNGGWYFDTVVDIPSTIAGAMGIQFWGLISGNVINFPLWYVDILLLCHIWLGAIVKLSNRLKFNQVYAYIVMVCLGIYLWRADCSIPFMNALAGRGYYAFFGGMIFAGIYEGMEREKIKKAGALITPLLVLIINMLLVTLRHDWLEGNDRYILTFIVYPSAIMVFMHPIVQKLLDFKFVGCFGKVTYDIYAWHLVIFFAVTFIIRVAGLNSDIASYPMMILLVLLAVAMGVFSYFFIDKTVEWIAGKVRSIFK